MFLFFLICALSGNYSGLQKSLSLLLEQNDARAILLLARGQSEVLFKPDLAINNLRACVRFHRCLHACMHLTFAAHDMTFV